MDEVYELFLDLDADEEQVEFPIVYSSARECRAGLDPDELADDLGPLLDLLVSHVPAPEYDPDHPLQALVTNPDTSPWSGRLSRSPSRAVPDSHEQDAGHGYGDVGERPVGSRSDARGSRAR